MKLKGQRRNFQIISKNFKLIYSFINLMFLLIIWKFHLMYPNHIPVLPDPLPILLKRRKRYQFPFVAHICARACLNSQWTSPLVESQSRATAGPIQAWVNGGHRWCPSRHSWSGRRGSPNLLSSAWIPIHWIETLKGRSG